MVGGFDTAGMPSELIDGLIATGARDLTIISNNAGNGEIGLLSMGPSPAQDEEDDDPINASKQHLPLLTGGTF